MIMVCQLNSASGEDYALTAVPHSILCASFHSARRTFVPKITQGKRLLWARLGLLHQSALKADMPPASATFLNLTLCFLHSFSIHR